MRPQPSWRTAGHRGARTVNADAVAMSNGVIALADGIGDTSAAAWAALTAAQAAAAVPAMAGPVAALAAAHRAVVDGDCVLVVAQPYAGGYHLGWVGDARAYAWDGADLWQLTRDHTVAQHFRDRGDPVSPRMEHQVTTSIATAKPTQYGLTATGRTSLLLTTDGVHKTLPHQTITSILRTSSNPAESLVRAALAAGTTDNTTAVFLSAAPPPATPLPTHPLPTAA